RPPLPMGEGRGRGNFDVIDVVIVIFIFLGLVVSFLTHGDLTLMLLGFKYDFIPLIAFIILRRVPWSGAFSDTIYRAIIIVGSLVAAYGVLSFFLPQGFFTAIGYSDLHSLYLPDAPIAAFQQIGGSGLRRIQSVMSGPNQLGLWLLLPWTLGLLQVLKGEKFARWASFFVLIDIALFLTFSRSAWIAACVIVALVLLKDMGTPFMRKMLMSMVSVFALGVVVVAFVAPQVLLRQASTRDHLLRPLQAIQLMREQPVGYGLGTAGPASNRTSDPCVHLPDGSDVSWAIPHPELCVFLGGYQVQPSDRECNCPVLPENWYLQIGVETGVLGFVLFVALIVLVLRKIFKARDELGHAIALSFLGISVAALFLHAWEDSAVAFTLWILLTNGLSRDISV
ncbi:MAG TPA: O-antigen ligase family protein, partial [Candidatus Peribacteraceae bacterium]|nr:O-antigen ligase family protein [Candidatus Peribacteraceae bacterium]